MTTKKERFHKNITIKSQRKQKRTSLRKPSNIDKTTDCVPVNVPQQSSQTQPATLSPVIQPATIPVPALDVLVQDPDFDCNDPATSVLQHTTTAKRPSNKRVFDKKEQRDEVLQPYLDQFINSDDHKEQYSMQVSMLTPHLTNPP